MMSNKTSATKALIAVALSAIVFSIIISTLIITLSALGHLSSDPVGPQQAFEHHLMALDDQDWELANTYVTERCQSDLEGAEDAGHDLANSGFSLYRALAVDEVWINEDGTEALLDLNTPPNLPLPGVATMERIDGEWFVSCS